MEVTVKLATREGAAHVSGILAGFTLLAKRGELTLRVQDERQGSPLAREALLETEINGCTVVFDLMDGYFYNCLLYTSPSPRDLSTSRMPSSA